MEEPTGKRMGRPRKPHKPTLTPEDSQALLQAVLDRLGTRSDPLGEPKQSTPLSADQQVSIDQQFKSQIEKYHAEPHFWFTWHRNGDDDKIEVEHIGAAGVPYYIRKEQRVLLPQSAINALGLAEEVGLDHGHPVEINGKRYLRRIRRKRFNYTVEPTPVSPEEAAQWRARQERQMIESQDLVPIGGGDQMSDFVEIGR